MKKITIEKLWKIKDFKPNENQEKAILHTEGPLLLTAGPGSGKTGVLLWRTLGINKVRFKSTMKHQEIDISNPSIVRDQNKCILCGDCVRMCSEIQGIGAIDFAHRGSEVTVIPAFGKSLGQVECVYCGQCASVCPTGALTVKSEKRDVWKALDDPSRKVVAQIAPAVRVALGEYFGLEPGVITTGQIVSALKHMGFARVYDTSFAADLTVIEESTEFIKRKEKDEKLPQFTSCCPAWVKFAEQYYPELLPELSSCRSPQQMFGSLAKEILSDSISHFFLSALSKASMSKSVEPKSSGTF